MLLSACRSSDSSTLLQSFPNDGTTTMRVVSARLPALKEFRFSSRLPAFKELRISLQHNSVLSKEITHQKHYLRRVVQTKTKNNTIKIKSQNNQSSRTQSAIQNTSICKHSIINNTAFELSCSNKKYHNQSRTQSITVKTQPFICKHCIINNTDSDLSFSDKTAKATNKQITVKAERNESLKVQTLICKQCPQK